MKNRSQCCYSNQILNFRNFTYQFSRTTITRIREGVFVTSGHRDYGRNHQRGDEAHDRDDGRERGPRLECLADRETTDFFDQPEPAIVVP